MRAVEQRVEALEQSVEVPLDAIFDPAVREVVQAADDLWASSVAKFQRLAQLADVEDARVRGAFVFAGGSATGRASSYGAQVHNFTRKVAKDPAAVRQAMVRGHQLVPTHGPRITDVLRSMLRPALVPAPGLGRRHRLHRCQQQQPRRPPSPCAGCGVTVYHAPTRMPLSMDTRV